MDRKTPTTEPRAKKKTGTADHWGPWADTRVSLGPAAEPIRRPSRPARASAARRS